jgi:uncharacterized protein YgiM (DUF1202 family)
LNVRQNPDVTAAKISALPRGENVQIIGEDGDWYHITANDGSLNGWVAKRYVDVGLAGTSPRSPAQASAAEKTHY